MKATDLMLGDWVIWGGKPHQIDRIARFTAVVYSGEDERRAEFYEDLEPIPLTPEILEKNGFEKRYGYRWEYRDNSCTAEINIAPKIEIEGKLLGTPPINVKIEGALFILNKTDDWYVHQLQHALRDCGIEKEIII